jgi:hypothetical protein
MSAPDFERVLWDHLSADAERECIGGEWTWARRCDCGWVGLSEAHMEHLSAALHAEVARWLADEGTREVVTDAIFAEHEPAYHSQQRDTLLRRVLRDQFRQCATAALAALTTTTQEDPR